MNLLVIAGVPIDGDVIWAQSDDRIVAKWQSIVANVTIDCRLLFSMVSDMKACTLPKVDHVTGFSQKILGSTSYLARGREAAAWYTCMHVGFRYIGACRSTIRRDLAAPLNCSYVDLRRNSILEANINHPTPSHHGIRRRPIPQHQNNIFTRYDATDR